MARDDERASEDNYACSNMAPVEERKGQWTEEEDIQLRELVAKCVAPRGGRAPAERPCCRQRSPARVLFCRNLRPQAGRRAAPRHAAAARRAAASGRDQAAPAPALHAPLARRGSLASPPRPARRALCGTDEGSIGSGARVVFIFFPRAAFWQFFCAKTKTAECNSAISDGAVRREKKKKDAKRPCATFPT